MCKVQHHATPFQHRFEQFCREHKNRHIAKTPLQMFVGPRGGPYGVFENAVWLPLRVFERLVASLLAQQAFVPCE